jgi:hypothetical protein
MVLNRDIYNIKNINAFYISIAGGLVLLLLVPILKRWSGATKPA